MKRAIFAAMGVLGIGSVIYFNSKGNLPVIAIANYGPHASLESSIRGLKEELAAHGFIENKTVRYEVANVGFDTSLIPQMIAKLRAANPKVMVVKTTPVAQLSKGKIKDVLLVFCDITDPVEAGIIKEKNRSAENITGSSDQGDLRLFLAFAKSILPHAKTLGLLYSTAESNDAALVRMMKQAASQEGLSIVAIPVDQTRDIPIRMQGFRKKVDFIYVGTSGPIQPALPIISSEAQKMEIPLFNAEHQAVLDGLALASFGVDYEFVGRNAGKLTVKLLKGENVDSLRPLYPAAEDHKCFINKKLAVKFRIKIPKNITLI